MDIDEAIADIDFTLPDPLLIEIRDAARLLARRLPTDRPMTDQERTALLAAYQTLTQLAPLMTP